MRMLAILLILSSVPAWGSSLQVGIGFGANKKQDAARFHVISYEQEIKTWFISRDELAYYNQPGSGHGMFITRSYGVKATLIGLELSLSAGVGVNTRSTARVSSGIQFTEQVRIKHGPLWMGYSHYSNAGIKKPNLGHDSVNFGIAIDF